MYIARSYRFVTGTSSGKFHIFAKNQSLMIGLPGVAVDGRDDANRNGLQSGVSWV